MPPTARIQRKQNQEDGEWIARVRLWVVTRDDCLWPERVDPYELCRVVGVVRRLRIDPPRGCIEATITDGVATLKAEWSIRGRQPRQLRAVPGRGLILEGIAEVGPRGDLFMMEPECWIVPGPFRESG